MKKYFIFFTFILTINLFSASRINVFEATGSGSRWVIITQQKTDTVSPANWNLIQNNYVFTNGMSITVGYSGSVGAAVDYLLYTNGTNPSSFPTLTLTSPSTGAYDLPSGWAWFRPGPGHATGDFGGTTPIYLIEDIVKRIGANISIENDGEAKWYDITLTLDDGRKFNFSHYASTGTTALYFEPYDFGLDDISSANITIRDRSQTSLSFSSDDPPVLIQSGGEVYNNTLTLNLGDTWFTGTIGSDGEIDYGSSTNSVPPEVITTNSVDGVLTPTTNSIPPVTPPSNPSSGSGTTLATLDSIMGQMDDYLAGNYSTGNSDEFNIPEPDDDGSNTTITNTTDLSAVLSNKATEMSAILPNSYTNLGGLIPSTTEHDPDLSIDWFLPEQNMQFGDQSVKMYEFSFGEKSFFPSGSKQRELLDRIVEMLMILIVILAIGFTTGMLIKFLTK